jgi:hypothetical protein
MLADMTSGGRGVMWCGRLGKDGQDGGWKIIQVMGDAVRRIEGRSGGVWVFGARAEVRSAGGVA